MIEPVNISPVPVPRQGVGSETGRESDRHARAGRALLVPTEWSLGVSGS